MRDLANTMDHGASPTSHEPSGAQAAPGQTAPGVTSASKPSTGKLKIAGIVALIVAGVVVAAGIVSRQHANHALTNWTQQQAIATVNVVRVGLGGGGGGKLALPATVQAFNNAQINSRVSGYLSRWYVDLGQHVRAGQLLAQIDTPEVDQQIGQARADLMVAQANQRLSATTARRWTGMLAQDAVSKQETDEKTGDLEAKNALVAAARSNVQRLLATKSFGRITAPFSGIVTTRAAEIGQLVTTGQAGAQPLFTIADDQRLRIYVHVPQSYSAAVHRGMTAELTVPEYPGRVFRAVLVNSAQAVTDQSGTHLMELQIDNPDGSLKPGEYAQARSDLPAATGTLLIPASSLLTRHSGMAVAVVGADSHVHIRPVTIARDLGAQVEISGGITAADRIVDSPADTLAEGDLVRVSGASAEAAAKAAPAKAAPNA